MDHNSLQQAAVLLNANAKRVSRRVMTKVEEIVPKAQLYMSHSMDDARKAVSEIVEKRHPLVFCGGGDGTLVNTINQIKTYMDEKNKAIHDAMSRHTFPTIGILKMGTGNAISSMIGGLKGVEPLEALRRGFLVRRRRLGLIEAEQTHFPFAGFGWDAGILNDYQEFRARYGNVPVLRHFASGFPGYMGAILSRTVPRELRSARPVVRVVNEGDEVYRRRLGEPAERLDVGPGDTLYEGPVSVMGAATTPYYGYNMVAFPFALERPGFMNLRVVDISVGESLLHSPSIFKGRYQSKGFFDFLATKVRMEFDRPTAMQIGGDPVGRRESVTFSFSDFGVDLLDFSPAGA